MAVRTNAVLFYLLLVWVNLALVAGVPRFIGPVSRSTYINENSPAGTPVLTVYAADDEGGAFTFRLTSSSQFTINSTSGQIMVASSPNPPLDREMIPSISFAVNLVNSAGLVITPSLPVTVFLNDVNDNRPTWRNPISTLPFSENTQVGQIIYTIVASDADIGENANIRFRIQSPTDRTFTIDELSGVVRLSRSLDSDSADSLPVTIVAEDEGSPSLSTRLSFTVTVAAVVSAPPLFTQTHYFVSLEEGAYMSSNRNNLITVVAVSDDDPDANIVYSKVSRGVDNDALFTVTSAGVVNVVGNLDRETANTYDVQIQAYITAEGLPNSASGYTLVTVTVLDVNDNDPVFHNPHPEPIVLMENTPTSTVIYTFFATDDDESTNSEITYELISPTNGPFSIGSTSGALHLVSALDYNTNPSYVVTIRARDRGSSPRSTSISVTINVADVVTAPPLFTERVYTFEVAENTYTNHEVGYVRAVDAENPSSVIRYERIMRGDSSDTLFRLSSSGDTAGRVTLTGTVNSEGTAVFTINIRAFRVAADGDTTPESEVSIVSVIIIITDQNDHSPVWTSTFSPLTIPESQPTGTDIFTATATDADSGSNGRITYSLVSPPANLPFSIDANSGVIRLISVLDYDTQTSYTLTIQAQDGGSPPNSITSMLTISVEDMLDLAPTFTESVYSVAVNEGMYTNEVVGRVIARETTRPNATIRYEKASGSTIFSVVSSGANAGQIVLTGTVDAENMDTYAITIRVSSICLTKRSQV
jgi:hypothetical protein